MEFTDKKDAKIALIMGTFAMLISFMTWSSISPLANIFATRLSISLRAQKLLVAVPVLLGSIIRIPFGILSDRFGGKKIYLWRMFFTLVPLLFTTHNRVGGSLQLPTSQSSSPQDKGIKSNKELCEH